MNLPELGLIYKVLNWHNEQRDRKPGEHVGIFATLPMHLAGQFPEDGKMGEDSSPSHLTVVYIGNLPAPFESRLVEITKSICEKFKPFKVKIAKPKKFVNEDNQTILHSPIKSKKLQNFHDMLKRALLMGQIPVDNKCPEYKPHVTIEYINDGEKPRYKGAKPTGEWLLGSVWIWGTNEPHLILLGK